MDLTPYVENLRRDLASAAEAGGSEVRGVAERLGAALDSAARLTLLDAISTAAAEITREIAPGAVDVRLRGRDPEFVVTMPPDDVIESPEAAPEPPPPPPREDDGATTRLTLRLPESLKARVEDAASREGLSVNAWLVRVLTLALSQPPRPHGMPNPPSPPSPPSWPGAPRIGRRISGWVR